MGESVTEVEVADWLKQEGEPVGKDDPVVVLETDKATVEVPAPVAGRIAKVLKAKGSRVQVGDVLAQMEPGEFPASPTPAAGQPQPAETPKTEVPPSAPPTSPETGQPSPTSRRVSPVAARIMAEKRIAPQDVQPTGPGGRIVKEDVLRAETRVRDQAPVKAPAETSQPRPTPPTADRAEQVVPMTLLRRKIAERLVQAQQTAALLTTFNEIDMSSVMSLRREYQEQFLERYKVKLGFMSFFVKATIEALKLVPQLNAEIRQNSIVFRNYFDVGVAIGSERGLVVPVLRHAQVLSFAEIEQAIADFAARAKKNTLRPDDLQGGTFTITNGGVFGSLLSTPIINPPQSGVLGMHTIQERPVALNGQVVVRPMMYVALTYDHRIVDGREAVTFLRQVKLLIENPARILLEI